MARTEKGSRLRGLPPFVRLSALEAASGSFPTKSRTSVDNRRGRYPVFFNDHSAVDTTVQLTHNYDPKTNRNLILWWRFEETTNFVTKDDGNGKHNGFIYNNYTEFGTCPDIVYDRYPSNIFYAVCTTGGSIYDYDSAYYQEHNLGLGIGFSFGSWFKASADSRMQALYYKGVLNKPEIYLVLDTGNYLYIVVYQQGDSATEIYRTENPISNLTSWNHFFITIPGTSVLGNIKLYINGQDTSIVAYTSIGSWQRFNSKSSPFYLGVVQDNDFLLSEFGVSEAYGSGNKFDDVLFFMEQLTGDEVSKIYNPPQEKNYGGLNLGSGLPSSSVYLNNEIRTGINITSASLKFGIGDKWITRTPGEDIQPFNDSCHPALDGMRDGALAPESGSFYSTGSKLETAGPGFQQALWHKTKIEIDLTPTSSHGFGLVNFSSGSSYAMAYFNKSSKVWSGVGSGLEPINYVGLTPAQVSTSIEAMGRFLEEKAVGFGSVINQNAFPSPLVSASYLFGNPIDNFGFPYHPKYSGSSNTTFLVGDYISEPFLLEKVVIYTSAALSLRNSNSNLSLATFFILNETNLSSKIRDGIYNSHNLSYMSGTTDVVYTYLSSSLITKGNPPYGVRDLVTWINFAGGNAGSADQEFLGFLRNFYSKREKVFSTSEWTGQIVASGTLKSPLAYANGLEIGTNYAWPANTFVAANFACSYREQWSFNGRSGFETGLVSKRDWRNVIETPVLYANAYVGSYRTSFYPMTINQDYSKENPYILYPTDKLIFGWHISGPEVWNYSPNGTVHFNSSGGPYLSFSNLGIHKVVLYGSLLRVGENGNLQEYHDTLNQHLTSVTIHEIIG